MDNNYQNIPVEFMLHCMKAGKTTVLRDYLICRHAASQTGSYFSSDRVKAIFGPVRVSRLLEEGWIVQIGPDWYRTTSVYKICADLDIKIKRKVTIRLDDVRVMSQRFKAYCLAQAERYVQYRHKIGQRKASKGNGANSPKAQPLELLAIRYLHLVTGLSIATISRIRNKYNHEYNSYQKVYCPDFDKLNYQNKEQVAWWVSQVDSESEKNIFFDKSKGIYRRILNTKVTENKSSLGDFYSISNSTIYSIYSKYKKDTGNLVA
jgi:hypothetical protein